jgi:hypothetical protein
MIRKSVRRFSLATNAECVCAEIMFNQKDQASPAVDHCHEINGRARRGRR